jgi:rod shape determining protein RodA
LLEKKLFKNFDYMLVLLVLALVVTGILMIGNATGNPDASLGDGWRQVVASMNLQYVLLTGLWFLVGLVAAGVIVFFDYHSYGAASKIIYWGTVIMLGSVLLIGSVMNGSKAWLMNGSIQPSELAKLALIIILAKHLSLKPQGIHTIKEFLSTLAMVAVPLVLIIAQPDFGTSLVYLFITIVMLFVSGTDWKLMLGLFTAAGAVAWPVWKVLPELQKHRFQALFDPASVDKSVLYNVQQSVTAIGSGQMSGRGFFAPGSFCQLDYIPEKHTDFIFSITGETWGFIGCLFVLALYALLLIRLLILSRRAFDRFGSYIIIGVMAMIAFHVFENIGMTLGVMPCTGIPLPFLSYGGSSMLTNLIAIGLVENVCIRRRYGMFREGEAF